VDSPSFHEILALFSLCILSQRFLQPAKRSDSVEILGLWKVEGGSKIIRLASAKLSRSLAAKIIKAETSSLGNDWDALTKNLRF